MSIGRIVEIQLVLLGDTSSFDVAYNMAMVKNLAISLWNEPRVANAPVRVWRDWVLVAAVAPVATVEAVIRDELEWRLLGVVLCAALASSLLWRRTRPLLMVALTFGAMTTTNIANLAGLADITPFFTYAYIMVLVYALFRWGPGRDAIIGLGIVLVTNITTEMVHYSGLDDSIFSFAFAVLPAVIGLAIRFRVSSQAARISQLRLQERELLARELHDTVAHHVSAIAVQAQAGQAVAETQPKLAAEVLGTIEDAASRALEDMRLIVGSLRTGEDAARVPQRSTADIGRLVDDLDPSVPVDIRTSGDLNDLQPVVDAAIYRLAQESITNALRHAVDATFIRVSVIGDGDTVRLAVRDDGTATGGSRSSDGFGLVGMAERATLLGGTFNAGPNPDTGWTVTASVPKAGVAV